MIVVRRGPPTLSGQVLATFLRRLPRLAFDPDRARDAAAPPFINGYLRLTETPRTPGATNALRGLLRIEQGRYTVQLPAGRYRLDFEVPGDAPIEERLLPVESALELVEGEHRIVDLR